MDIRSKLRLIPACAGKTPHRKGPDRENRAHPRVCGENAGGVNVPGVGWGSSPRVRGKQKQWTPYRPSLWLIPACAGKTHGKHVILQASGAHPRVCGENFSHLKCGEWESGSSPRVRGKPDRRFQRLPPRRLIPACAGKTMLTTLVNALQRAHPRVCGENRLHNDVASFRLGSSPRVRGKRLTLIFSGYPFGLIPACAGKTRPI